MRSNFGTRKWVRRLMASLMAVVLCLTMLPMQERIVHAETSFAGGTGTETDPYLISTKEQLAALKNASGYYKLANDINISGAEWTPIDGFTGQLDGAGYSISGLTIGSATVATTTQYAGLFKKLNAGTVVENLNVDVAIYATRGASIYAGGIAAICNGTIQNCTVSGTINVAVTGGSSDVAIGGIVGYCNEAPITITDCVNKADIVVTDTRATKNTPVGGILGRAKDYAATIVNCSNLGSINAGKDADNLFVGGVLGLGNKIDALISNYNAGVITVTSTASPKVGTIVGKTSGILTNVYWCEGGNATQAIGSGSNASSTGITKMDNTDAMKAESFLSTLNENAKAFSATYPTLHQWEQGADGYPVLSIDKLAKNYGATSSVTISGVTKFEETLTATLDEEYTGTLTYQWQRKGTEDGAVAESIEGATSSTYTLAAADVGKIILCAISKGGGTEAIVGATNTAVSKADAPAAPAGLGTIDATTVEATDGKITGTTAAMEYSSDNAFTTPIACTDTETPGLAVGTYYVRYKETDTHFAGAHTQIKIGDASNPGKWTDEGHYATSFTAGTGIETDPYVISSAAELAKLAKEYETYANAYFKMADNAVIDLSAYEWTPIEHFAGYFDGNNVKIMGMKIGTQVMPLDQQMAGLFAKLDGATVENVILKDISIDTAYTGTAGFHMVGGIVGHNNGGTIDNCMVLSGVVNAKAETMRMNVGGIAGQSSYASDGKHAVISNCYNAANVTAVGGVTGGTAGRNVQAGGIVGYLACGKVGEVDYTSSLLNCANAGSVSASTEYTGDGNTKVPEAGGLIGAAFYSGTACDGIILNNCYNAGTVSSVSGYKVGALAGNIRNFAASNLYWQEGTASKEGGYVNFAYDMTPLAALIKSEADMKDATYAGTLNINAAKYNEEVNSNVMNMWQAVSDGYPTPDGALATGRGLTVTANSTRLGSITVEVSADGTNFVPVSLNSLVQPNSTVKITVAPALGCDFTKMTLTGGAAGEFTTLTDNTHTFVMNASTEVYVEFEVGDLYTVNPIYVDPDVTTSGDGVSPETPFKTLKEAKEAVQAIIAQSPAVNVTVNLMGGTYYLEETLNLTEVDSAFGTVTWKKYNEEEVIFTSGKALEGRFTKVDGKEYYSYQLQDSEKVNGAYPVFRDLFINGERANLARSDSYTFKKSYSENGMYVDEVLVAGVTSENIGDLEIMSIVEWKSRMFHIGSVETPADGLAEVIIKASENFNFTKANDGKSLVGREYWMQNHISFLDEPGEFYYDRIGGTIYYIPYTDQDLTTALVEYGTLDQLINLDNAANITFDGITFTGTTMKWVVENGHAAGLGNVWFADSNELGSNVPCAAIYANDAENVAVQNCTFTELGGSGVLFNLGAKNISITGNRFTGLGMNAVIVGKKQRMWHENGVLGGSEDITISNNYITNIGKDFCCAPAIMVARSVNLTISHNTIVHVPYSAIFAGSGFNIRATDDFPNLKNAEIANNYIEDCMYAINDGGAIYVCGANAWAEETQVLNTIHDNVIKSNAYNKTYTGIYHDGSSSNYHTYNNVIIDVKSKKSPMFFQDDVTSQYSHNITVENNYTTAAEIITSAKADRNIVLNNNTTVTDMSKLPNAALGIMAAAGLEDSYKGIISPMDTVVKLTDDTIHYTITEGQVGNTTGTICVTNNSDMAKTFKVSLVGVMTDNMKCQLSTDTLTLAAGGSGTITMTFSVIDMEEFDDSLANMMGILVEDSTGRSVLYPRFFTAATVTDGAMKEIKYGTPVIDGIKDEAYNSSAKVKFGSVFHPDIYAVSDVEGYCQLLWDENYLYCYAVVSDSTVLSQGTEWITTTWQTTHPWKNDALETYIATEAKPKGAKTAVDAFGVNCYGHFGTETHAALPFATAFTYNGEIIEGYKIENPTANQAASTVEQPVNGYVIEMTLPITQATGVTDGVPKNGDIIKFYVQNNDFQEVQNGEPYVVALANVLTEYLLVKEDVENNVASIDGVGYATLEEALKNVEAGKTVKLEADATLPSTGYDKAITYDLNGHTLSGGAFNLFSAKVMDSSNGEGLLVVPQDKLSLYSNNDGYMPVWDNTNSGYRFAKVTIEDRNVDNTGDVLVFSMRPSFGSDTIGQLVAAGYETGMVRVGVRITWTDPETNTTKTQDLALNDTWLSTMYGTPSTPKGVKFTISGGKAITNFTATTIVWSNLSTTCPNMEITGETHTYPATVEE